MTSPTWRPSSSKWLGVLADYDERKHTELVKTLTQYLQHGGGYEATSQALSVHRSTLKYRLHRIRELTGFDLGDPETLFNLQLATRAWLPSRPSAAEAPHAGDAGRAGRSAAGLVGPARTRPGCTGRRSVQAMDVADGLDSYERMCFLRHFEERADALYRQGLIHGPAHLGLGQEAIAVGAASVLRPGDCSLGTYRGHAHALARGAPPDAVLAELLGRAGGICGGKGGSMHITSVEHGYYGVLRDRRRAPPDRLRARLGGEDPPHRAGHGVLLRRRDDQHRRVPRGGEPGRGLAAAGRVRVREQLVHGVHADLRT